MKEKKKASKRRKKIAVKKWIISLLQIIIGTAIMSVAISFFLLPNQLSSGGFTGIATITYYLFDFQMGTVILILNIPLFIMGYLKLGKEFFVKAILGTVFLSIFIDIFDRFQPITTDRVLACIYGGVIIGLRNLYYIKGQGINWRNRFNYLYYKSI